MARNLQKKVVLCDSLVDGVPTGNVHEILLDDTDSVPKTIEEVEVLVETGKVATNNKAKCRAIVAGIKTKTDEGIAAEALAAQEEI